MVTHTFATPNYILFLHQKGIVCVIENQRTVTELFCCCLFLINIAVYANAKVGVDALIDPKKTVWCMFRQEQAVRLDRFFC